MPQEALSAERKNSNSYIAVTNHRIQRQVLGLGPLFQSKLLRTRSQAIARIATRTASQHLRTSSVTWPFDSPYAISYWWSFGTQSLNPAVFEILP